MSITAIIDRILAAEGSEYTDDPADSGGPTRWGITQAALARYRRRQVSAAEVAALTREEAFEIYRERYYIGPNLHLLAAHSERIAEEVIDTGVNIGTSRAVEMLQRLLTALNDGGRLYGDIVVDGRCGPATAAALEAYLGARGSQGETVLQVALNCMQGAYYLRLTERREKDERFLYGWLRSRVVEQVA